MGSIQLAELKKEANHYSFTGGVVSDTFWRDLEHRYDVNPDRFGHYHPNIVGFFTPPKCLGEPPNGPLLDGLRHRFDINPERFTRHHPFWGPLLVRDAAAESACLMVPLIPVPVPIPPSAVPEPGSAGMLGFCIAAVWIVMIMRRSGRTIQS